VGAGWLEGACPCAAPQFTQCHPPASAGPPRGAVPPQHPSPAPLPFPAPRGEPFLPAPLTGSHGEQVTGVPQHPQLCWLPGRLGPSQCRFPVAGRPPRRDELRGGDKVPGTRTTNPVGHSLTGDADGTSSAQNRAPRGGPGHPKLPLHPRAEPRPPDTPTPALLQSRPCLSFPSRVPLPLQLGRGTGAASGWGSPSPSPTLMAPVGVGWARPPPLSSTHGTGRTVAHACPPLRRDRVLAPPLPSSSQSPHWVSWEWHQLQKYYKLPIFILFPLDSRPEVTPPCAPPALLCPPPRPSSLGVTNPLGKSGEGARRLLPPPQPKPFAIFRV